ncbi:hypothetical protein MHK_002062 [Candidatus Magnetomorum sp. HK-1]|nr:hypothetical protein MHK_002062 [Candidatus Magnetomorum sp. HK-1]
MKNLFTILLISIICVNNIYGEDALERTRTYPESWYQEKWCQANNGTTEIFLTDNTRADCVTSIHIIEFDFADKWYESIAQSLHYHLHFPEKRKPGIVLIIEDSVNDNKYWDRLNHILDTFHLPVDTWTYGNGITGEYKERFETIQGDTNGDARIGLEEAIHALQILGKIKTKEPDIHPIK